MQIKPPITMPFIREPSLGIEWAIQPLKVPPSIVSQLQLN